MKKQGTCFRSHLTFLLKFFPILYCIKKSGEGGVSSGIHHFAPRTPLWVMLYAVFLAEYHDHFHIEHIPSRHGPLAVIFQPLCMELFYQYVRKSIH